MTTSDRIALLAIYIDTITAAEQRRTQMSTVYSSLLVAGFASIGIVGGGNLVYLSIAALALAQLWCWQLDYFKNLTTVKWKTVKELEAELPSAPFGIEHQFIKIARAGRHYTHRRLIDMEQLFPRLIQAVAGCYLFYLFARHVIGWEGKIGIAGV